MDFSAIRRIFIANGLYKRGPQTLIE